MSVSMRSTKAQMYSEIERLRDYADRAQQQLRDAVEEIDRLRAKHSAPRAQHQAPNISERRTKLEALKLFATKFKCSARLRDGVIELYSRKRQCWVAVPEGAQP